MDKIKFLIFAIVSISICLISVRSLSENKKVYKMPEAELKISDPPCVQMYFYIEKYAEEFDIPKNYAYGIAHSETGYNGPFDWDYDHKQTSHVGALGPMQIMPNTAKWINGKAPSKSKLKTDIEYNVKTSMKLLRKLKDQYGDWKIVFGCYNTGRPLINNYALNVYKYQPNWQ